MELCRHVEIRQEEEMLGIIKGGEARLGTFISVVFLFIFYT